MNKMTLQIIKRRLLLLSGAIFAFIPLLGQPVDLTLEEAIALGRQKSFEAFKAKNSFVSHALDYQTTLRLLYPKLSLSLTPSNYSRSIEEQWNSYDARYEPYEVQRLTSNGSLSLTQYIAKTGGTVTVSSYLYRYKTFKEKGDNYTTCISNPLTLTYSQNFAGVNTFRWQMQIDSVGYTEARKQYLEDVETNAIKTVGLFFDLLNAEMNYKIAELNRNSADTLFFFGKKKLEIGAISRDNYLNLQLKKVNAGISLESSLLAVAEARLALNNFLELPRDTKIRCWVPDQIPDLLIPAAKAMAKAFENNPDMVALKSELLVAKRAIKSAKANRFSANFSATVGFNQNQEKLVDAYRSLLDQESVSFTLSVPIVDWGDTKRSIAQAELNRELAEQNARKEKDALTLEILNMVNNFNIKYKQVAAAAKADSIARIAYQAVQQQFMLGKASVLEINSSYTDMQNAQNNYLSSLNNFWTQFYVIRKLCLYDFEKESDLDADFDYMLKNY